MQLRLVRSIRGFERAHITRPGYAIEYDFFDPRELQASLETKAIRGLFFAGQINGTTGYEEAAAQGLLAGINAARCACASASRGRRAATRPTSACWSTTWSRAARTSRTACSRAARSTGCSLREDNADLRLTPIGRALGLVDDARWRSFEMRREWLAAEARRLNAIVVRSSDVPAGHCVAPLAREVSAYGLLRRPEAGYASITALARVGASPALARTCAAEDAEQLVRSLEIAARYQGYVERQSDEIERQKRQGDTALPAGFDYSLVHGLSNEIREKLERIRPQNVGQAARISGVTPAAVSLLLIHLKKKQQRKRA